MPLLLYTLTALLLLVMAHRFVRPLSRWAAVLLFVLPFVFVGHALVTSRVWAPVDLPWSSGPLDAMKSEYGLTRVSPGVHSDVYTQFIPWRKAVQWSLGRGEWGLWNPFMFAGDILTASEQPAVYSPLTWIACLMPAALSFTFTGAITIFIAGLCAFLFAREQGCREAAAMIAAAGWAFSSAMMLFVLISMSATWAWAPLLFLGVCRVVEVPSIRSASILSFAFTVMLASGHPESLVLSVLLAGPYGLFELVRRRTQVLRATGLALAAAAVALLLSAIHLLPFLEALPQTMDYVHRTLLFANQPRGATGFEASARIASTVFPYLQARPWTAEAVRRPWYEIGAAGSLILALALYALVRVRSATSWVFGALAVLSLLGHAEWRPLVALMQKMPVLDITLTDRLAFGFALLVSILAAMGAEELFRRERDRAAVLVFAAVLAAIAAGNWWLVRSPLVSHDPMPWGTYVVAAEIGALILALVVVGTRLRWAPALLLGLIIAQRVISIDGMHHSFEQRQAYPPIPILEATKGVREPFRITGHGMAFLPQTATLYELEDVRGFTAMTLLRYRETYDLWCIHQPVWFNRVDDLTRPFLSFLNVRYAITWDREPPPPGWREVARQPGSLLLENTNVIERIFVPRAVRVGYTGPEALAQMAGETDFRARAWIEAPVAPHERANGPARLSFKRRRLGWDIDAQMDGDGWIVASVLAWKGWRAYIDGRRVQTQFANHAFVGVYVPQGRHKVQLVYWPESFVRGRAITVWSAVALATAFLWRRLRRRK